MGEATERWAKKVQGDMTAKRTFLKRRKIIAMGGGSRPLHVLFSKLFVMIRSDPGR